MIHFSEKNTVGVFFQNAAEGWIDIHSNVADKVEFYNYSVCLVN